MTKAIQPPTLHPGGFTLVELIVTIAILGIVLTIGSFSFSGFTHRNQVNAASDNLQLAMSLARSEAVTRGTNITVCRSANSQANDVPASPAPSCTTAGGTGWETGFIVFVDADGDGIRDAGEELIRPFSAATAVTVVGNTNVANRVRYLPSGFLATVNDGTWIVTNTKGTRTINVIISTTGRVRTL